MKTAAVILALFAVSHIVCGQAVIYDRFAEKKGVFPVLFLDNKDSTYVRGGIHAGDWDAKFKMTVAEVDTFMFKTKVHCNRGSCGGQEVCGFRFYAKNKKTGKFEQFKGANWEGPGTHVYTLVLENPGREYSQGGVADFWMSFQCNMDGKVLEFQQVLPPEKEGQTTSLKPATTEKPTTSTKQKTTTTYKPRTYVTTTTVSKSAFDSIYESFFGQTDKLTPAGRMSPQKGLSFKENFKRSWPSYSIAGGPANYWSLRYGFSNTESKKSQDLVSAGESITLSKNLVDVAAVLATGTGVLDGVSLAGELYDIGAAVYGKDSEGQVSDMVEWVGIMSVVKDGVENKNAVKSAVASAAQTLKARKGAEAASAAADMAKKADTASDASKSVSSAQVLGLNVLGAALDYAVIDEVAWTSRYEAFEMNEHAKMAYISRHLVELYRLDEQGRMTSSDAKKAAELEIFFYHIQKKELSVRRAYWERQRGFFDTLFSYIPVVNSYTAEKNIKDIKELEYDAQKNLESRISAREKIYTQSAT